MATTKFILLLVLVLAISSHVHAGAVAVPAWLKKAFEKVIKGYGKGSGQLPPAPEPCRIGLGRYCKQKGFKYCCPKSSGLVCTNKFNGC
ncbi:hypothetical protein ACHQM5_010863 [Ranunculus cassubicifolius]